MTNAHAPWQSVASFGLVSAVAILAALFSVLLVLPALVCSVGAVSVRGGAAVRSRPCPGTR